MTLRHRLLAIVAVAILPAIIGVTYLTVDSHRQRAREVRDQALRTSEIIALEMERIVSGTKSVLRTLEVTPDVRSPNCPDYLASVANNLQQISGFAILSPTGSVFCSAGGLAVNSIAGQPWFTEALERPGFAVGTYSQGIDHAYLPVAIATEEAPPRVLVTGIDLAWLGLRLRERNLAEGSVVTIADRDGTILARQPRPEDFVGKAISQPFLRFVQTERPGTAEMLSPDGTRRIVGYQPPSATDSGLYVASGVSTEVAFGPVYAATWRTLALAGAGALAACLLAWIVGDRLFRQPIRRSSRPSPAGAPATIRPGRGSPTTPASFRNLPARSTNTWTASCMCVASAPPPSSGARCCCAR